MLGPARRRRMAPPEIFKKETARAARATGQYFDARVYSAASAGGNWLFGFVV